MTITKRPCGTEKHTDGTGRRAGGLFFSLFTFHHFRISLALEAERAVDLRPLVRNDRQLPWFSCSRRDTRNAGEEFDQECAHRRFAQKVWG